MPRQVKPSVTLIASSQARRRNMTAVLTALGVSESAIERLIPKCNTDSETITEFAGRRCYMSFQPGLNPNVTKIRSDIADYIGKSILANRHGSVLEHCWFTFSIENVSRVFTAEMNRHRVGTAISEGSMRYIRYADIPYWIPTIWQQGTQKEAASRKIMEEVFRFVESRYQMLEDIWSEELLGDFKAKKELTSAFRRIIPMGVATGGVWSCNIRALRHIFEMRCSPAAEEEILLVATTMLMIMKEEEPLFFQDFNPSEHGFMEPKYSKV